MSVTYPAQATDNGACGPTQDRRRLADAMKS